MTIEEMIRIKKSGGFSYKVLSELSGLEGAVIQKIFSGKTKSPRHDTIIALEKAFEELLKDKRESVVEKGEYILRDAEVQYGSTNVTSMRIADYMNLTEDEHKELIDGKFYDMATPSLSHQTVLREIGNSLINSLVTKKGKCQVFFAPLAVQLDRDDKTMVEPDIMVVCDRDKYFGRKFIFGAPDFIIEILSDSTRKKDMTIKLSKYEKAGVREYWIIDPEKRVILSYVFADEITPTIYTFDDDVPVAIYDGKIKVNFKEIQNTLTFMGV